MAAPSASFLSSLLNSSPKLLHNTNQPPSLPSSSAYSVGSTHLLEYTQRRNYVRIVRKASSVAAPAVEEPKEFSLPTWAEFDLGKAPVFWKTMNGLPPSSGEMLTLFYNPAASSLTPNDDFGIAFNGGFNQPIMCGSEPRQMRRKKRGKADSPIFTIKVRIPKHATNIIFSFTNGNYWDGPYKLQFEIPKMWRNQPPIFFNKGLAEELSEVGACEEAIFPDSNVVIGRCVMMGNLSAKGGDRCQLEFVPGCTDPSSPSFNPLANVDDGSCPLELDSDSEEA